jgi:RNA-directed DNA polymerase
MMENVPMYGEILRKILKSGFVDCGKLFPTEKGTAQGGVISPTIFNCVLDGLESEIRGLIPRLRKKIGSNPKINYVRYADDFIVTGANREILEQEVKPAIEKFLLERGLQLSQEKTVVTHINDGFDFLGCNVRKFKGELIIQPAKKRGKAFLDKVRNIIRTNKAARQRDLINQLNPVIRGWANHHKTICAKKTFSYVDYQIWKCLWKWAKRRHPDKSGPWVLRRYNHPIGTRSWVFAAIVDGTAKQEWDKYLMLAKASDTKIIRHVKVVSNLNPYDDIWAEYLEKRRNNRKVELQDGDVFLISDHDGLGNRGLARA